MPRPNVRDRKPRIPPNVWRRDHHSLPQSDAPSSLPCLIKSECGSCHYINEDYQSSLERKFQNGLAILKDSICLDHVRVMLPEASPRILSYRNHAKLAVRPSVAGPGRFAIGLFKPQSHDVVELSACPIHRSTINAVLLDLKVALEASGITPYDETSHTGDLRYLAIRSSHLTVEVMITFVATHDRNKRELRQIVCDLKAKGHNIAAALLNINEARSNTIFGPETRPITTGDGLRERLCDLDFQIGPTGFFQINPSQAERMYRRIEQLAGTVSDEKVAWDLYSGIGQIALILARCGYRTLGIEENPEAVVAANKNATKNRISPAPTFLSGRVEDVIASMPIWARRPQLILANPARTGIADSLRPLLADVVSKGNDTKLIYVSCEVKTLARDVKDFVAAGRTIIQLQAFDMFPFTDKLEWLAVIG